MKIVFLILSCLFILFSILPILRREAWWIRIFDFPRLQVMVFSVATAVAFFVFFNMQNLADYLVMGLLCLSVFYQAWEIIPYTPLWKIQSVIEEKGAEENTVRMLISNVRQKNKETHRLIELVRKKDPDIFLAVETDDYWYQQLNVFKEGYAFSECRPLDNTYGMLLYSKLKLINPECRFLVDEEVPSVKTEVELTSGSKFRLYCIHPKPPQVGQGTEDRDAELVVVGKEAQRLNIPTVVAGDLNDVAWSYTTGLFQRISGMLDPRRGRGFFNTYNANVPFFRWPLDHVFHSEHFQLKKLEVCSHIGSDHFPVYIELVFIPQERHEQEKPEPDVEDEQMAYEKMQKAGLV